jgi:hypothetical protein
MKKYFENHNLNCNIKLEQVKQLILKCLAEIDAKFWKNCIRHCKEIEEKY